MVRRSKSPPAPLEADGATARVRALLAGHDEVGAGREALVSYGAEIYGFLLAVVDGPAAAMGVYADVRKRVETEVGSFTYQCSLRTWLYILARRELRERRLQGRDTSSSQTTVGSGERRVTPSNAIRNLRVILTQEEHELLILHVDRKLSWRDIAMTELGERAAASDKLMMVTLAVQSRTQAVIQRLRHAAADEVGVRPDGGRS